MAPKREALAKAEEEHEAAMEVLSTKKVELRSAQEKLKNLSSTLQQKKERKAELENDVELCSRKLERAEQLIQGEQLTFHHKLGGLHGVVSGFGDEREKWAKVVENLDKKLVELTGNILLCAGMVAYLGAFRCDERSRLIEEWKLKAKEVGIQFSEDWSLRCGCFSSRSMLCPLCLISLRSILGDEALIQTWRGNGLLKDDFTTENAIILSTAKRWVLMIDPDDIAARWIKLTEKNCSLSVLKQTDKDFLR